MLNQWLTIISQYRLIAVIRAGSVPQGLKMAQSAAEAGVKIIEVTWGSKDPLALVKKLRIELPDCYIGIGTILSVDNLKMAIDSGVQFAFSPHLDYQLIDFAHQHDIPFIPGTLSPTEIITAVNYGAKTVKVFPIQSMGGIDYIKNVLAPTPHLPLIPTGGVKVCDAVNYIRHGATAVGLSTDLFLPELLEKEDWSAITKRAKEVQSQLIKF